MVKFTSHETVRSWCIKFGPYFRDVIKKRERKPGDKWHLDEMALKIRGKLYWAWRAIDADGHEIDILVQRRRNKKAATRFLSRLLGSYPVPRVAVTDRLRSYLQTLCKGADHRRHKRLNNRVENAHQPTRRKEKCLIKFKSPKSAQSVLSLMGKVRNIFSVYVGRYKNPASVQKDHFCEAKAIWNHAAAQTLCV